MISSYLRAALFVILFLSSTGESRFRQQIENTIKDDWKGQGASRLLRKSARESHDVSSSSGSDDSDKSSKYKATKAPKSSKGKSTKRKMSKKQSKATKTKGTKSNVYKEVKETSELDDDSNKEEETRAKGSESRSSKGSKGSTVTDEAADALEPVPSASGPSKAPVNAPEPTMETETENDSGGTSTGESDLSPQAPVSEPNGDVSEPSPTTTEAENAFLGLTMYPTISTLPSLSPEPTTTIRPTFSPSMTPVPISEKACQVGPNGLFGTTITRGQEVNFFYQMETTASVTQETVNEALLPQLETALGSRLLAFHFDECRQDITLRGEIDTICRAQGYSEFPTDRVLLGVSCLGSRVDPSNNCFVVDAGASLHFESESDCSDALNSSKQEIRNAMDSGAFNDVDERIVKLTFIEESDLDFSSPDTVQGSNNGGGGETESGLPVYAWALIGLGGVTSLIVAGLVVRRRRRSSSDEIVHIYPIEGVDIVREPSISDNTWYDQKTPSEQSSARVVEEGEGDLLPRLESQDEDALESKENNDLDVDSDAPVPDVEVTSGEDSSEGSLSDDSDGQSQDDVEADAPTVKR